jgi:hypothetical protein
MTPLLPTDATPTAQQVFDAVVRHAAKMPGRSNFAADDGSGTSPFCAYRGKDDNACFVGCLLTDAEAAPLDRMTEEQTGGSVRDAYREGKLPQRLIPHVELLGQLQPIHDNYRPDQWEAELRLFASKRGLSGDAINEAFG